MTQILLIDDDTALAPPLRAYFARFDLDLAHAATPRLGLEMLAQLAPELVILDVMLPEMDGFEVCRTIRKTSEIPILMLTARGEVMDRIVGLELGADDYLAKPFEPRELVARVQSILKRAGGRHAHEANRLRFAELEIDLARQQVTVQRQPVTLTNMEFRLLELLATHPGKPFSRDDILNALRGVEAELYTRAVDILVSRLRQKLKPLDYIKTVWAAGYSFVAPRT